MMFMMRILTPIVLCTMLACQNAERTPPSTGSSAAESKASATTPPPPSASSAPPATTASLAVRVKCAGKTCDVELTNEGEGAIEVVDLVQAERHDGSTWTPSGYALRVTAQCGPDAPKPPCITLAKGASTKFDPWTGMTCDPRCPCKANAMLKPGEYRFVAQICGSGKRFESAAFSWPP